jgi:hypothetical protein
MTITESPGSGDNFLPLAAYLRIVSSKDQTCFRGALFLIDAFGEPRAFAHNQIKITYPFLWLKDDLLKRAYRTLVSSILHHCTVRFEALFYLDAEIPENHVSGISGYNFSLGAVSADSKIRWIQNTPEGGSETELFARKLSSAGLLMEPFERAEIGLVEIYGERL